MINISVMYACIGLLRVLYVTMEDMQWLLTGA